MYLAMELESIFQPFFYLAYFFLAVFWIAFSCVGFWAAFNPKIKYQALMSGGFLLVLAIAFAPFLSISNPFILLLTSFPIGLAIGYLFKWSQKII